MRVVCALLGVLLTSQVAQAETQPFGDVAVVHGLSALQEDNAVEALRALEPVAQRLGASDPNAPWTPPQVIARFLAAEACIALNRGAEAMAYLADLDTPLAEVGDLLWTLRGRALVSLTQWDAAEAAYNRVLRESHSSNYRAEAIFSMADIAYAAGQNERAERLYHMALRALPHHPRAAPTRLRLAEAATRGGRFDQAAELLRKVTEGHGEPVAPAASAELVALQKTGQLSSKSLSGQLNHVDHLLAARSLAEALALLESLVPLAHTPTDREHIAQRRAQWALRNHDFPQALALLEDLVQGNTGRPRLTYQRELAAALAMAGRTDAALAQLDDVAAHVAAAKDVREVQFKAAWLAYEAGRWSEAQRRFAAYIAAHPRDHNLDQAMWLLAWNTYHGGDKPQALARMQAVRRRFAHSALASQALYWEGRIQAQMGQRLAALAALGQVATGGSSYYAMMARRGLIELGGDANALPWQRGHLVAALTPMGIADVPLPPAPQYPTPQGKKLASPLLAWEDDIFNWHTPHGVRTLRLVQLGQMREAASCVMHLPIEPKAHHAAVEYARARLLFGLGDFAGSFRSIGPHLHQQMSRGLCAETRRYYQLAYPEAYPALVASAAREFHLSPYLLLAVMRQESGYNDGANSQASARGLMQIIPVTGRRIAAELHAAAYTDAALRQPVISVRFGAWYLAQLLDKFDGNLALAISSYNAGPQTVEAWARMHPGEQSDVFIEDITFKETRNYVKQVLANLAMYERLYHDDVVSIPANLPAHIKDTVHF